MTLQALHLIDNQWQPAQTGTFEASVNPADGSSIGRYAASAAMEIEPAIAFAPPASALPPGAPSHAQPP